MGRGHNSLSHTKIGISIGTYWAKTYENIGFPLKIEEFRIAYLIDMSFFLVLFLSCGLSL